MLSKELPSLSTTAGSQAHTAAKVTGASARGSWRSARPPGCYGSPAAPPGMGTWALWEGRLQLSTSGLLCI